MRCGAAVLNRSTAVNGDCLRCGVHGKYGI